MQLRLFHVGLLQVKLHIYNVELELAK